MNTTDNTRIQPKQWYPLADINKLDTPDGYTLIRLLETDKEIKAKGNGSVGTWISVPVCPIMDRLAEDMSDIPTIWESWLSELWDQKVREYVRNLYMLDISPDNSTFTLTNDAIMAYHTSLLPISPAAVMEWYVSSGLDTSVISAITQKAPAGTPADKIQAVSTKYCELLCLLVRTSADHNKDIGDRKLAAKEWTRVPVALREQLGKALDIVVDENRTKIWYSLDALLRPPVVEIAETLGLEL